ncbi:hypothetical protein ACIBTV_18050 [Micromonospora sp. NPDC049366]|uniref:hypothetical protein n=1 Tax=Micromonospora sp. NPDC049366 TaxID=3364271 RepID=UPI0037BC5B34
MTGRRSARKPDDQPAEAPASPDRAAPPHQLAPHQASATPAPSSGAAPPHQPAPHQGQTSPDRAAPPPAQAAPPAQARRGRRQTATGPVVPAPASPPALPGPAGGGAGAGPVTEDSSAQPGAAPVEVEPTTGAPVDALPRRVPVRQPKRWHRGGRATRSGMAEEDDDPTFWPPIEEVHWDGTPIRAEPERKREAPIRRRRARRAAHPPDPLPGLAALLALSLVAAFFAWVSAGPLWVALGHSTEGRVAISDCTGGGLTQRCRGVFTADGGRFIAHGVRVSGVPAERAARGAILPARMTGPEGGTAYADRGLARHLRWMLGLLMVVACGAGIARWTGGMLLGDPRARRWAVAAAFGGPALITLGFLAAAW